MHQVRSLGCTGSIYIGLIFNIVYSCLLFTCATLNVYITLVLYCVCVLCGLHLPCFMVGYMYSIGSSAIMVDYINIFIICYSHCRGIIHPYSRPHNLHCFSSCTSATRLGHVTGFGQYNVSKEISATSKQKL